MTTFKKHDSTSTVNFKKIYSIANEFLATSNSIISFPFNVKKFIKEQSDIQIRTFDKAHKYNVDISAFGSESAIIIEQAGANIIFYNQDEPLYRKIFSILHEFGHYIFGHGMNLNDEDELYRIKELEANCFAAQMLMPEQLLRECTKRGRKLTSAFIQQAFNVSNEAAERRIRTLAKTNSEWRSREEKSYDDIILLKYALKLDAIAPKKTYSYDFDIEYDRQLERDSWLSLR